MVRKGRRAQSPRGRRIRARFEIARSTRDPAAAGTVTPAVVAHPRVTAGPEARDPNRHLLTQSRRTWLHASAAVVEPHRCGGPGPLTGSAPGFHAVVAHSA